MKSDNGQIPLPFAEREFVDIRRAAKILGVSNGTVMVLHGEGALEIISYKKRAWMRVRYQSVVDFCDALRIRFCIADRRPQKSPHLRYRDEDLLPFPMSDTISVEEAMPYVHYSSRTSFIKLIEEGLFESYQIQSGSPWRISRASFFGFVRNAEKGDRSSGAHKNPQPVHS